MYDSLQFTVIKFHNNFHDHMTSKSNLFFGVIEAREPALGCIFESVVLLNCEIGLGRCEFCKMYKR